MTERFNWVATDAVRRCSCDGWGTVTGKWIQNIEEKWLPEPHGQSKSHCTWIHCHVSGIFDSVPCSPVGPFKKVAHRADCSCLLSPMPLFRIRSRSQKPSDRPKDSSSASSSSSKPHFLPQTNLALSTPEDTSSSSSSDDLDVSPSKHPFGSKIFHSEPDEPK